MEGHRCTIWSINIFHMDDPVVSAMKASASEKVRLRKPTPKKRGNRVAESPSGSFFSLKEGRLQLVPPQDAVTVIRKGSRFSSVQSLARHLGVGDAYVLRMIGITGGTVTRRRQEKLLKPEESDRLYRILKIANLAERVLEEPDKARSWLQRNNRALGGVAPLSLTDTQAGVDAIEDVLNRIEFGVYG